MLVLPFMLFNYAGYNVFNGLLAAGAMDNVTGGGVKLWLVITAVVAVHARPGATTSSTSPSAG